MKRLRMTDADGNKTDFGNFLPGEINLSNFFPESIEEEERINGGDKSRKFTELEDFSDGRDLMAVRADFDSIAGRVFAEKQRAREEAKKRGGENNKA